VSVNYILHMYKEHSNIEVMLNNFSYYVLLDRNGKLQVRIIVNDNGVIRITFL